MDYEKLYKEALERAKDFMNSEAHYELKMGENIMCWVFPELRESEDERIRKALCKAIWTYVPTEEGQEYIAWLEKQEGCEHIKKEWLEHIKQSWYKEGFIDGKYSGGTSKEWTINDTTTLNELIDFLENGTAKLQHDLTRYTNWLKIQFTPIEKQGEPKSVDKEYTFKAIPRLLDMIKPTEKAKAYCQKLIDTLKKEGYHTDAKIVGECLRQMNGENVAMAVMDVQPIIDKVEPKFKVGDWVVYNRNDHSREIMQIYDIRDGRYYFTDNVHFSWSIKECDEKSHLWTIADAKPGDILFHSDSASNGIFIFKELLKYEFSEKVICYCDYDSEDHFCLGEYHTCCWADAKILHPATKEQREQLEKAMADAGYRWNLDEKKMEKIEQKPSELPNGEDYGIDGLYAAVDILKKTLGKVDGYQSDDGILEHKCAISAVKELSKQQKSAWSEEDDEMLDSIIEEVRYIGDFPDYPTKEENELYDECLTKVEWLKSLKERIKNA